MVPRVKDLEDTKRYRQISKIPYDELVTFILDYLRRKSGLMVFYWSFCIILIGLAAYIRINISGYYPLRHIFLHTLLGLAIFPVIIIPVHEFLHIIPFLTTGAKRIRIGMDLKQYMFYVTAHEHVVNAKQFSLVGFTPFALISAGLILLIFHVPPLWKWSLSLLLFVHATMCAGDFAMMNFFYLNRDRKLYTWDDADKKTAYFYEEI